MLTVHPTDALLDSLIKNLEIIWSTWNNIGLPSKEDYFGQQRATSNFRTSTEFLRRIPLLRLTTVKHINNYFNPAWRRHISMGYPSRSLRATTQVVRIDRPRHSNVLSDTWREASTYIASADFIPKSSVSVDPGQMQQNTRHVTPKPISQPLDPLTKRRVSGLGRQLRSFFPS